MALRRGFIRSHSQLAVLVSSSINYHVIILAGKPGMPCMPGGPGAPCEPTFPGLPGYPRRPMGPLAPGVPGAPGGPAKREALVFVRRTLLPPRSLAPPPPLHTPTPPSPPPSLFSRTWISCVANLALFALRPSESPCARRSWRSDASRPASSTLRARRPWRTLNTERINM